jgi:very-short-patch-repair endonuclease
VDTQVGCSSFKIDMALKQPGTSNYLLAIECDGASYHSSKSARDRDRLRQAILESMGWRFYRIWSTDWFNNKAKEKERLLKAVQDAIENVSSVPSEDSYERQSFEQIAEKHCTFPKYQLANIPRHTQGRSDILTIVKSILEVEAPVSEEWLLRRLAFFYGRQKVTSVVQESFNYDMRNCSRIGILRRNGFLYLQGEEIPMLRVPVDRESAREVKHIAIEELANGMLELLKQNGSAEISGLFHSITQHLGFCRMGPSITERLEEVLKSIQSKVRIEGDSVFLE